jgi:hypothetical protein
VSETAARANSITVDGIISPGEYGSTQNGTNQVDTLTGQTWVQHRLGGRHVRAATISVIVQRPIGGLDDTWPRARLSRYGWGSFSPTCSAALTKY